MDRGINWDWDNPISWPREWNIEPGSGAIARLVVRNWRSRWRRFQARRGTKGRRAARAVPLAAALGVEERRFRRLVAVQL